MHLIIFLTPFLRGGFRITGGSHSDFRRSIVDHSRRDCAGISPDLLSI